MTDLASNVVFDELAKIVKQDPSLVSKTGVCLAYRITKGGNTHVFTVDLKNAPGAVYAGEPKTKADCELTLSDDDFVGLVTKKANPQNLFMQGKLKLKGNMAAGMKFEKVLSALAPSGGEVKAPAAASSSSSGAGAGGAGAGAGAGAGFASKAIFDQLATVVKSDPSLVGKTGVVLLYRLSKGSSNAVFTVDLKNAPGSVYAGEAKSKADVELSLSDDDFVSLVTGKAKAQNLFMGGKLKLKGNMAAAMKFEKVLGALAPKSRL